MREAGRFDAAIVGASIAGCTAARFFALAGARVALIERRPDPDAYKVVCTHQILSSATPTIERLGLAPLLEARGAIRIGVEFWTPYGGWFRLPEDTPRGWGVTRRTLDPMVRQLAASTPGVELLLGETVVALLGDDGRPAGVQTTGTGNRARSINARLVVGADGRGSTVARLAAIRGRVRPHNRFFYFAYWRGVRPRTANARAWLLDPDAAAQFPNEDDLTALVTGYHRSRLTEVRADLERTYMGRIEALPNAPDLSRAERVSKLIGKLEMPNVMRSAARPGIAFVGDAAVASDPLVGVGCGWAFQSAEWLTQAAAPTLVAGGDLDTALDRYRRQVRQRLGPHHFLIADYASGRRTSALERAIYRAAAADPYVVRAFEPVGTRRRSPAAMLNPRFVAHVIRNQVAGTGSARADV